MQKNDIDYILLLCCVSFSFFCATVKQLYDYETKKYSVKLLILQILVSASTGIICGCILSSYLTNKLAVIGFSGLGGLIGLSILKIFVSLKLGKAIKIRMEYDDD